MGDEHEYIIKMPEVNTEAKYGLGHEIFHKLKSRHDEIAEYIVEPEKSVTFGECLDAYTRIAINLRKLNLSHGDLIAVCAQNHEQTVMPIIAGLFNGNIVTCLEPSLHPRDTAMLFKKVTPKIVFVDEEFLQNIEEAMKISQMDIKIVCIGDNTKGFDSLNQYLVATEQELEEFHPIKLTNNDETAMIVFSSGTTGSPKGVCLSHSALLCCTEGFTSPVLLTNTTPAWISYNLWLIRFLREGGARVISKNSDLSQTWRIISKYKVTVLSMTIYGLYQLLEQPLDDSDLSSLTLLTCVGAVLSPSLHSRLKKILPHVIILQAYGLTEACGIALALDLSRADHQKFYLEKPNTCGAPLPGFYYKIVDPETEEILGPNKAGELRLKSKVIMQGYYKEDSSDCFDSDGYFKTGDIMKYDEDNCFYFVDRLKEVYKFRMIKWSATALENILMVHPAVEVATVIGIPNEREGHIPMGIVKLRPESSANADELRSYVDNLVGEHEKLRAGVKILDNLPVTATGKIQKKVLLDIFSATEMR